MRQSYRKGHKYITVIVNHDTNTAVWASNKHGKEIFSKFLESLTSRAEGIHKGCYR